MLCAACYFPLPPLFKCPSYGPVYSSYNFAHKYGGGMYYADSPTIHQCLRYKGLKLGSSSSVRLPYCFLQGEPCDFLLHDTVLIHSQNDTSGEEGDFLYGGLLDRCRIKNYEVHNDNQREKF